LGLFIGGGEYKGSQGLNAYEFVHGSTNYLTGGIKFAGQIAHSEEKIMNNERIEVLDALRGYALMGLFLIHMSEYYEIYWLDAVPHWLNTALFAIFGGKSFAIFGFLFGVSFFIILNNQRQKGRDFRLRFLWRLTLLLGLGYLHGLIYGGDILQVLAICGLLLIPLWSAPNKIVFLVSLIFLLQIPAWLFIGFINHFGTVYPFAFMNGISSQVLPTYAEGSFLQVIKVNAFNGNASKWIFMFESGRLWTICGLSTLGFLLARMNLFAQYKQHKNTYVIVMACAIIIYLLLTFGANVFTKIPHVEITKNLQFNILSAYQNLSLTLVSIFLFVILYHTALKSILKYLAAPGRMTLSIYVSQSLICVPIFYGFGLHAWSYLGQVNSFLLGVALWIIQIIMAYLWFKYFRYGPLEWLWRAATHTTAKIPFRK